MTTNNIIKIIIAGIVLGIFCIGFNKCRQAALDNDKAMKEILPDKFVLSNEDSALILPNAMTKIRVHRVMQSKVRAPISIIVFDSLYYLIIHKLPLTGKNTIEKVLHINRESTIRSTGVSYNALNYPSFELNYKGGLPETTDSIYLTLAGDSLETIEYTPGLISYYMLCNNFSIRLGNKAPIDIFFERKSFRFKDPLNILFLQRNKFLYLMFMTPIDPRNAIPRDLINQVVVNN